MIVAAAIIALLFLLKECNEISNSESTPTQPSQPGSGSTRPTAPFIPPVLDPNAPLLPQIEAACGADSKKDLSTIIDRRLSSDKVVLTATTRNAIGKQWMQSPEWKKLVILTTDSEKALDPKFVILFNTVKNDPSVSNVQELQRWVGMEAMDDKAAQDGILGPLTTRAINTLITKCNNKALV